METVENLTLENMGIALEISSLGCTDPEIHLGVIYPPPPNSNVRLKNTIATLGLRERQMNARFTKPLLT